jgi:hypothetical protein
MVKHLPVAASIIISLTSCSDNADTWKVAAQKGDAHAQLRMAEAYLNGTGVAQDYGEAAKWLQKAAEQGLPEAQFKLGRIYYTGKGTNVDQAEGRKWLEKAAASYRSARANLAVGLIELAGDDVAERSPVSAMLRLEEAFMMKDQLPKEDLSVLNKALAQARREAGNEWAKQDAMAALLASRRKAEEKKIGQALASLIIRTGEEKAALRAPNDITELAGRRLKADSSYLKKRSRDGSILVLGDGSAWEVDPMDKALLKMWPLQTDVATVEVQGRGNYDYFILNTRTGERIRARHGGFPDQYKWRSFSSD